MIQERLAALRQQMRIHQMDAYIVPTEDYHASEYVGDFFKAREYMSGFTGSAGTLVVLRDEAALWTDGRYFLQAEEQLKGSEICLMKSGEAGVPDICNYLAEKLNAGAAIGFDGRTVSRDFVKKMEEAHKEKQLRFVGDFDCVGEIWTDRPAMSPKPVWELSTAYAGKSRAEKLAALREKMTAKGANACLLNSLDEIAWLLNLRGADVAYTPVFLAFLLVSEQAAVLCAHQESFSEAIWNGLEASGVSLAPYEAIGEIVAGLPKETALLVDTSVLNAYLWDCIPSYVQKIETASPVRYLKAMKTEQEMEHMRQAHVKDGVAVTRFLYWLKHLTEEDFVTEIDAAAKLEQFRREQAHYLYESFSPIVAYGAHGAIVHYEATTSCNARLEQRGLCLIDTGGHYMEGTTDITRTVALGELTKEERSAFTAVLRGHLNLAAAQFPEGVCGQNLDILARMPLWEQQLDFRHGTGHGVGYLLSVHEGPQRIHWRIRPGENAVAFEEGMIVSNEPGYYETGKFGIRHENLMLCKKVQISEAEQSEYGQFLCFETLTMAPFDIDAIDVTLLTERECKLLDAYHKRVYETIGPLLDVKERQWLEKVTAPIERSKHGTENNG